MDQTASLVEVHLGDLRWEDHQKGANRVAVVVADTALVEAADFRNEPALGHVVGRSAFEGKVHPSLAAYWGYLVVEVAAVNVGEVPVVVVVQVVELIHFVVVRHIEAVGQVEAHIYQVAAVAHRTFLVEDHVLLGRLDHILGLDPMVDLDIPVEKAGLLGCK